MLLVGKGFLAAVQLALVGHVARLFLVLHYFQHVAGGGNFAADAQHLGGLAGLELLEPVTLVVYDGAHFAVRGAHGERVAHAYGAGHVYNGGHDSLLGVEPGFYHYALPGLVRVGLQLHHLGLDAHDLQQLFKVQALLGGNFHHGRLAAPVLGQQPVVGQLLLYLLGIGGGKVDLVYRDDDRRVGGLGVVDGFQGLRHDAVHRGNDKHDYVRYFHAVGAHGGERLVARGIQHGYVAARGLDHVGADVLRYLAGLGVHHV